MGIPENFWYDTVKYYYDLGIYSKEDVKEFWTPYSKISEEQYYDIIGEKKPEPPIVILPNEPEPEVPVEETKPEELTE